MTTTRTKRFLAALAALALAGAPARAKMIAPAPLPLRVAAADLTVAGKVTALAGDPVPAGLSSGDTRPMQIVLVQVAEVLEGKAGKQIKVGYFPPPPRVPGARPFIARRGSVQLAVGQEAVLLLTKHPTQDCYTVSTFADVTKKAGNPAYAKTVEEVKKCAALLAGAKEGLRSKDAQVRFTTAALLVARYRTPKPGNKTAPAPAGQSKEILLALAEADWSPRPGRLAPLTPQAVFYRLNLTAKDGWAPPKDFRDFPDAAKKWLKDNAGTYQIPRYVAEKPAAVDPPGK
jgi:hypothetical protein